MVLERNIKSKGLVDLPNFTDIRKMKDHFDSYFAFIKKNEQNPALYDYQLDNY